MALSNYGHIAFGTNGQLKNDSFASLQSGFLEIYKTWIYIRNNGMWHKGLEFSRPTIAEIKEGRISISGFDIVAKKGLQNGVYVFAKTYKHICNENGNSSITNFYAGVGCYGYDDNIPRLTKAIGVEEEIKKYDNVVDCYSCDDFYVLECWNDNDYKNKVEFRIKAEGNEHLESQFVGVEKETIKDFVAWLEKEFKEEFASDECIKWFENVKKTIKAKYE